MPMLSWKLFTGTQSVLMKKLNIKDSVKLITDLIRISISIYEYCKIMGHNIKQ